MLLDPAETVTQEPDASLGSRGSPALAGGGQGALRRLLGIDAFPTASDDLPPELAFLLEEGVAAAPLHAAARAAEAAGVSGEAALFARGFSDFRYYRLLARHLGATFLERPLCLAQEGLDPVAASVLGFARLTSDRSHFRAVAAPRGEAINLLLGAYRFAEGDSATLAITTPRRFDALLRRSEEPAFLERASAGLTNWDGDLSAREGVASWQRRAALALVTTLACGLGTAPGPTLLALGVVLFALFAAALGQRLVAVAASPAPLGGCRERAPDRELPVYTLIVPLFREGRVLPQLVRNLDALDYPAAKLDIKIMLEAGDHETIGVASRLALPPRYDVIVLPYGHPRTKPRALNAALEAARGEFVVVYDAEDRPDPGQLREAVRRFATGPRGLACLQARLAIDHADETWITRLFAIEYAALFQVLKPGLAALGLPIPLGGTSNHFRIGALRRAGGWDAWNVTEDIDLGYRLARFGLAVGSLDSTTYEEAPLKLARWLPQRSRWLKGWMVTLVVHGRRPVRFFSDFGWRAGSSVAVSLLATVLSALFGPPLLVIVGVEAWLHVLFAPNSPWWYFTVAASAALLAVGAVATLWPALLGLRRLGRRDLAIWLLLLPPYLLLVTLAAWRALVEAWRDPQAWNKTEHGLARQRSGSGPVRRRAARGSAFWGGKRGHARR